MKNENSVAIERLVPTSKPPRMVDPERLVPGTRANMEKINFNSRQKSNSLKLLIFGSIFLCCRSM